MDPLPLIYPFQPLKSTGEGVAPPAVADHLMVKGEDTEEALAGQAEELKVFLDEFGFEGL